MGGSRCVTQHHTVIACTLLRTPYPCLCVHNMVRSPTPCRPYILRAVYGRTRASPPPSPQPLHAGVCFARGGWGERRKQKRATPSFVTCLPACAAGSICFAFRRRRDRHPPSGGPWMMRGHCFAFGLSGGAVLCIGSQVGCKNRGTAEGSMPTNSP